MKTAVLISGQMRTFKKCYPTQRWQIFRHYEPDIHFFVSSPNDDQRLDAILLKEHYKNVHLELYEDPTDLPDIPTEKGRHAPYANAAGHYKLMLQHRGNKKVWDYFRSQADPSSFDVIIRIRPDLWIHRFEPPRNLTGNECFAPWWGKFGGINDRLAIMGSECGKPYFTAYDAIQQLLDSGCPFHPETIVAENLRQNGCAVYSKLMTEFSTMRMDGSQRWAEIVMSDLAELVANK